MASATARGRNSNASHTTKGVHINFNGFSYGFLERIPLKRKKPANSRLTSAAACIAKCPRSLRSSRAEDQSKKHGVTRIAPVMSPSHQVNQIVSGGFPWLKPVSISVAAPILAAMFVANTHARNKNLKMSSARSNTLRPFANVVTR